MTSQQLREKMEKATQPPVPKKKDWKIGCIGAGFIMKDCQLVAYRSMGFQPYAITSLSKAECEECQKEFSIPKIYDTWMEMLQDESLEIIDIAIPPHEQLAVVKEAIKHKNIKGILCQKPISMSLEDTREIVELGKSAGIKIAVNSNMRFDQSMRALKCALEEGVLGTPVLATIEMRAIPHWQGFLKGYDKLEIFGMGIHHVDIFRYLFGDPERITAVCRTDPRTKFDHVDGITQYTYQYANGMMATSLDDVWAGPSEIAIKDNYIKWRVEGTEGMAEGTIGWPLYPERSQSTLKMTSTQYPGEWIVPTWEEVWFPDAFRGTMSSLLVAVEEDAVPEIDAEDNIKTIACVEACYASIKAKASVLLEDILK